MSKPRTKRKRVAKRARRAKRHPEKSPAAASRGDDGSFEAYRMECKRDLEGARVYLERHTRLPQLEGLCLKLMYLFGRIIRLSASPAHDVVRHVVAKLTNELASFVACVRQASLQGAWNHVRAIYEVDAALFYLFADEAQRDKRVRQFVEYERIYPWQRRKLLDLRLASGKITKEEYAAMNLVSDALIEHATPEQITDWKELYSAKSEKDLAEKQRWHDGSIKSLLLAMEPDGSAYRAYEQYCHPTHVSPIGYRLSTGKPQLIGFEQMAGHVAIDTAFGATYLGLRQLQIVVGDALMHAIAPELDEFARSRFGVGLLELSQSPARSAPVPTDTISDASNSQAGTETSSDPE